MLASDERGLRLRLMLTSEAWVHWSIINDCTLKCSNASEGGRRWQDWQDAAHCGREGRNRWRSLGICECDSASGDEELLGVHLERDERRINEYVMVELK